MKTWIEKAAAADIDEMGRLYDSLNDYLEQHVNYPGWHLSCAGGCGKRD